MLAEGSKAVVALAYGVVCVFVTIELPGGCVIENCTNKVEL